MNTTLIHSYKTLIKSHKNLIDSNNTNALDSLD